MQLIRLNKLLRDGVCEEKFSSLNPNTKMVVGTREEILNSLTEQELEIALRAIKFKRACEAMDKVIDMFDMPVRVLYGDEALAYLKE